MSVKGCTIGVRLDSVDAGRLDTLASDWATNRSGAVRRLIELEHKRLEARQKRKGKK